MDAVDLLITEAQRAFAADALADSAAALRRALGLQPQRAELWALLARIELQACALPAHDAALDEAIRLRPDKAAWRLRRALRCPPMMGSRAEIAQLRGEALERLSAMEAGLRARPERLADPLTELPNLSYYFVYHGEDDRPIHEAMHRVIGRLCPQLRAVAPHTRQPASAGARPRVGVFSPHLKDHTIGNLFGGLWPQLDPAEFVRVGVFLEESVDARALRWAQGMDELVLLPRALGPIHQRLAAARLDLLLSLDVGMDPLTALLGHARLARVQATTWGHPVTTGAPELDLFFTMRGAEVPGEQAEFSERLVALPRPNLAFERQAQPGPADRAALGLPPTGRLYGCPQSAFKLHPDFDAVLIGVLDADPEGVLLLHGGGPAAWRAALLARLGAQRPALLPRIRWMGKVPKAQYLAVLAALDVMLDPFPFGGGNTTLEAIAVGTPVVSCPPPRLRGRLASCFLREIGVTEGIVTDTEGYIRQARQLAGPGRAAHRAALLERGEALWAQPAFAQSFAEGLRGALGSAPIPRGPHG